MTAAIRPEKKPVFAVIRYTHDALALDFRVTVTEVLPTREEAEREVARLNALVKQDASVEYFVQPTRFYPAGRNTKEGY